MLFRYEKVFVFGNLYYLWILGYKIKLVNFLVCIEEWFIKFYILYDELLVVVEDRIIFLYGVELGCLCFKR